MIFEVAVYCNALNSHVGIVLAKDLKTGISLWKSMKSGKS